METLEGGFLGGWLGDAIVIEVIRVDWAFDKCEQISSQSHHTGREQINSHLLSHTPLTRLEAWEEQVKH